MVAVELPAAADVGAVETLLVESFAILAGVRLEHFAVSPVDNHLPVEIDSLNPTMLTTAAETDSNPSTRMDLRLRCSHSRSDAASFETLEKNLRDYSCPYLLVIDHLTAAVGRAETDLESVAGCSYLHFAVDDFVDPAVSVVAAAAAVVAVAVAAAEAVGVVLAAVRKQQTVNCPSGQSLLG